MRSQCLVRRAGHPNVVSSRYVPAGLAGAGSGSGNSRQAAPPPATGLRN
jgi:hypothetical protein